MRVVLIVIGLLALLAPAAAQVAPVAPAAPAATAQPPQPAVPKDALGRDTPRGTVQGFANAVRSGRDEAMPLYLNTRLRGPAAVELARQLFVVLDRRLPPRLNDISDRPEGSRANPLKPDQDTIGTITTASGPLDIVIERVDSGTADPIWLFSRSTLEAIPDAYYEIDLVSVERFLPEFLTKPQIGGIRLFQWLVLLLVFPLAYRLSGLVGQLVRPMVIWWRRQRERPTDLPSHLVPGSIRLLLLAVATRWLLGRVELPLLERQFWSRISVMLVIVASIWMLLLLNARMERYLYRRSTGAGHVEVAAILRLVRRVVDALVVAAGVIVTVHYFGFDPTAALAGLGIGGIAIALAAQKTLENVVGGLSIIFDKAVCVGDFLKVGDTLGTVDAIGLRSTRIRTLDRTILSVPNGQIANVNIETLSVRDKFWFHHFIGLRYETTSGQMRVVVNGARQYLAAHPMVDRHDSIRVRFLRFGRFSLDVEVFAYLYARDWEGFLETQQEMLLDLMEIVERSGATIALPAQTVHFADAATDVPMRASGAREAASA